MTSHRGFVRDFATADGERVVVAALTHQQFAELVRITGLTQTFAYLGRLLRVDFSSTDNLDTYRATIGVMLAPWFARRTVSDLTVALADTSVAWACLRNRSDPPGS